VDGVIHPGYDISDAERFARFGRDVLGSTSEFACWVLFSFFARLPETKGTIHEQIERELVD
jgi:hypothetical protein